MVAGAAKVAVVGVVEWLVVAVTELAVVERAVVEVAVAAVVRVPEEVEMASAGAATETGQAGMAVGWQGVAEVERAVVVEERETAGGAEAVGARETAVRAVETIRRLWRRL